MRTKSITTIMVSLFLASALTMMVIVLPASAAVLGGPFGNALEFDGVDDYVQVPDSSSLRIPSTEITIEAWIYFPSNSSGLQLPIRKWLDADGGWMSYVLGKDEDNKIYGGVGSKSLTQWAAWITTQNITDLGIESTWAHIAFTWKKENINGTDGKIFVNGVGMNTTFAPHDYSAAFTIEYDAYPLYFARKADSFSFTSEYFEGKLDEVRISSVARTAFNLTAAPIVDANTVALWHFDESAGLTAYDASPNVNHGTIFGCTREDLTPPVTLTDYDGLWHTEDFTIALTATDIGSGVAETYYRINDGLIQNLTANGQPRISTEGANNKLEYWSRDNDGNEELPHKILTGIKLDKTASTGSVAIAGGAAYANTTSVTLTLSASDDASGVAQMRFSNDNVTWSSWEAYDTSKTWTLTASDGFKTVYVQFKNNAGLISSSYQDTITLDATKPVANAGQNQTANVGTAVALDAGASNDNLGIVSYEWNFGDGATGTGKTATHEYTQAGTYTVTLTVKDAAGNTATDTVNITVLSAEAFPMWIAGVAAAIIAIAAVVILLLRKRK